MTSREVMVRPSRQCHLGSTSARSIPHASFEFLPCVLNHFPSVEVNAIECDALRAERNHCDVRTHVAIEAVLVHAQVLRRIAQASETRGWASVGISGCIDDRANFITSPLVLSLSSRSHQSLSVTQVTRKSFVTVGISLYGPHGGP
jgi:hypothetical protein